MSLVEELKKMVGDSSLGTKVIAEELGKNYVVLLNELNTDNTNHKLGADMIVPLMKKCNSVAPLHYLAGKMGGVFVELPEVAGGNKTLVEAITNFGKLIGTYGDAIADGIITDDERAEIKQAAQPAITAIQALILGLYEGGGHGKE